MKPRKIALGVVAVAIVATIGYLNRDSFNPSSAAGSIGGVEKSKKKTSDRNDKVECVGI